ncbi:MAG: molybdopterin biosynthesis protein [Thermodesulfovibrionales bacterium]|nr:molybdopterin biosynthesis protein [Thermodesulfovibrionales bacterium]
MKKLFLETHSLQEALDILYKRFSLSYSSSISTETINVKESLGRITAEPVFAKYSSPFYHSAAMDGYAVRFRDTINASEKEPKYLKINEEAIYVDTGDPLPYGFDAVVMIEEVNQVDDSIEIYQAVTPYQNIRLVGEDIVATELIIPQNHKIRAIDIGAMLASGILEIKVRKKPIVSIIPTGSELIEPEEIKFRSPAPPEIIEYNSAMLSGLVEETGGKSLIFKIVKDNLTDLKTAIYNALQVSDIVLVNAGSGRGSEDFTLLALKELGEVLVKSVSIKPGKPVIISFIHDKIVIGIPGYPISAYLTFELFVKPLILQLLGQSDSYESECIKASFSRQIYSQLGVDEFIRVKVGMVRDRAIATPLGRGAGLLMSLVRADGFVKIPSSSEGYNAGTEVEVKLIKNKKELERTIVCIGSHDNVLDMLANTLKKNFPKYSLSSAHVGSMGGLMALKKGEAHIAGTHLIDEESGEYNIPFIKKFFPQGGISLINLVYRQQGLVVKKGNPKKIESINDLLRDDVIFINRQKGSGTRILFDKFLKDQRIDPQSIKGYEKEEYTHMAIASAVLTGIADVGLAIYSSAKALGLDFIPVANERYDIAIPTEFLDMDMIKAILSILNFDNEFKEAVLCLGGYGVRDMGKIIFQ